MSVFVRIVKQNDKVGVWVPTGDETYHTTCPPADHSALWNEREVGQHSRVRIENRYYFCLNSIDPHKSLLLLAMKPATFDSVENQVTQ